MSTPPYQASVIHEALLWLLHRLVFAWIAVSSNLVRAKQIAQSFSPAGWGTSSKTEQRGALPAHPGIIAFVLAEAPALQSGLDEVVKLIWW